MGLLKAAGGAIGGVLADQWREFFYCDALPDNVIVKKGQKRTSARSSNVRGEDNIISNGSIITVNNGQCMIIVEQGRIVEFCADPGEYVYDMSTEPSLFYGPLGKNIVGTFKAHRSAFHIRRRHGERPTRLLFQPQRNDEQPFRHCQRRPFPRCR